jgi:hypothetical protein
VSKLITFFSSPSNRTGLIALFAALIAGIIWFFGRDIVVSSLGYAIVFGVSKILQPDNTISLVEQAVEAEVAKLTAAASPAKT